MVRPLLFGIRGWKKREWRERNLLLKGYVILWLSCQDSRYNFMQTQIFGILFAYRSSLKV